jgi:large subunit ribosomal protein L14e
LIDGPNTSVPRQAIAYRHLILTPYTITKLPRAAGTGAIKKAFEKAGVAEKWEASGWAKKLAARQVRKVGWVCVLVGVRVESVLWFGSFWMCEIP